MNKLFKNVAIIMAIVSLLTLFSGCIFKRRPDPYEFVSGDFICRYTNSADSIGGEEDGEYVFIMMLTGEGKKKLTLIIPEEINGKPVIKVGHSDGMGMFGFSCGISSGKYRKLYFPPTLQSINPSNIGSQYIKYFFVKFPNKEFLNKIKVPYYVPEKDYDKYVGEYIENGKEEMIPNIVIANVNFILDGEVHWIDDYRVDDGEPWDDYTGPEEGTLIAEPPLAQKDGYEFDGWYKEQECINKWDFNTDMFMFDRQDVILNLYAGWRVK